MTLEELFKDKNIKAKDKTTLISEWLLDLSLPMDELLAFSEKQKDAPKGICIEAIEYASKLSPTLADQFVWQFVTQNLTSKAPKIKWESAKIIGNTAHLFPDNLETTIANLVDNTTHEGTVVRWSAAFALGEILKLKTPHNEYLIDRVTAVCENEEKNSIKKIYLAALKAIRK